MQELEFVQQQIARQTQGLARQVAGPAVLAPLGWLSIEAVCDISRLLYLWRILMLPWQSIYRQILTVRLCDMLANISIKGNELSVAYILFHCISKYNLLPHVSKCMLNLTDISYYT